MCLFILNDNILGSTIANNLFGGAGNDTINGNTGKDTLTGGLGADVFVFNTALNASTNVDTITDFTPKEDSISLKKSIFSKLSVDSNQHVQLYQSTALPTSSKVGYLVYNAANGELAYDADGSAGKATVNALVDERDDADELTQGIIGVLLGDKGYIRPYLYKKLLKRRLELQTPLRKNMTDSRCKKFVGLLCVFADELKLLLDNSQNDFIFKKFVLVIDGSCVIV